MTVQTSQLALVTSAFAAGMENNLVAGRLVRWRVRGAKNASQDPLNKWQYIERVKPRFNVRRTSGDFADISAARQSREYGSEIFTLNDSITLDYDYSDFAHIRDEDTALREVTNSEISQNAGEDVDADILKALVQAGCNWVGTPGNNVASIEALMNGYVRLKKEGVPENDIVAVLALEDMAPLAKYLVETVTAASQTQESVLARFGDSSRLKQLVGLRVMFTQQLPILTTGTRTNGAVNGANQDVDYKDVARSTTTNGNFLTQTIAADGFGANATIKDGEVFTIVGVNAYDNRKGASQGRLQEFRVIGDHTADGAGAVAALRIFPAMIVPTGTLTGDAGVNNAHATVTAAPADGAVITFKGSASTEYLQRALVSRNAIRVETAEPEDGASGENARRRMMSIPLTLRGYRYTTGDTMKSTLRFDAVYKPNIEPYGRFKSVRING